jgi:hypothetical protein
MIIPVCNECRHGAEKEGRSHCQKEAVYSYLTRCIQLKALEYYLEKEGIDTDRSMAV